jgi:phosphoribosyl-ATP pyrophosphohydrolase
MDASTTTDGRALDALFALIEARRQADPSGSYTAQLLQAGPAAAAKKLGEEAVEAAIEGARGNAERLVAESADLLYHLLVLWAAAGVKPQQVWAALAARQGTSGLAEKAARRQG